MRLYFSWNKVSAIRITKYGIHLYFKSKIGWANKLFIWKREKIDMKNYMKNAKLLRKTSEGDFA